MDSIVGKYRKRRLRMSSPRLRIKRGSSAIVIDNDGTKNVSGTMLRPGPLSKKSKVTSLENGEEDEPPMRVQQFIREMKDSNAREGYIKAVDKHVDKLLESVRDRRSESSRSKRGSNFSSRKPSQETQIAETTRRIDLTSADSILGHVKNPRVLLNPTSFESLPLFYQYKLVKMLPSCDQLIGKSGWVKPSAFSLTNEFFTKACTEWCDSLKEGKFNPEILTRRRMEIEKEKSKLDPFKLEHFEPIWGAKLESAIDQRSEYDRIPRTIEFLISPSSFLTQACTQQHDTLSPPYLLQESVQTQSEVNTANGSSDGTDIDYDVDDLIQSESDSPKNQKLTSPSSDKPLKSILKKPRAEKVENGITIEFDTPTIEVSSISLEKPSISRASSPPFKMPAISITPIVNNPIVVSPIESQPAMEASPKRVRIQSEELNIVPTTAICNSLPNITIQEAISCTLNGDSHVKSKQKGSPTNDQSPRRTLRASERGKSGKNSQGVDEMRSLLICKEAVEKSVNNKLFYAQNGKIHSLSAPANQEVQQINTCNGSSIGFIADIYDVSQPNVSKILNDVEITPVSVQLNEAKIPLEPTPIEITVQDIRDHTELTLKPSILSNYLSQKQQKQATPAQNLNSLHAFSFDQSRSHALPYKLPNGITITPFSAESSMSQVPVITHGSATSRQVDSCQDLVRLPSQITVIPLGMSSETSVAVTVTEEHVLQQNLPVGDCQPTMICNEVAQHAILTGQPTILTRKDLCACDGKAFTPCAACGSFCHADCIGPSRLCVNCLARINSYNSNPQAISVIAAPNNPGSGPATAYFCHI